MKVYKAKPVRSEKPEEVGQLLYREIASYLPLKIEQSRAILESMGSGTGEKDRIIEEKDKIIDGL